MDPKFILSWSWVLQKQPSLAQGGETEQGRGVSVPNFRRCERLDLHFTLWFRPKSARCGCCRCCTSGLLRAVAVARCERPRCHRRAPGSSCASIRSSSGAGGKDWTFLFLHPEFFSSAGCRGDGSAALQLGAARRKAHGRCGTSRQCRARPPALPAATSQPRDAAAGPGSSGLSGTFQGWK